MQQVQAAIDAVLDFLANAFHVLMGWLAVVEIWGRARLAPLGLDPRLDSVILVAIAVLLLLIVLRLFGGLLRAIFVILLLLFAAQVLLHLAQ